MTRVWKSWREWQNSERGASAVEFAIILPVLLLILFGIIEFGLLLYNKQVITNASREGARAGIVSPRPRLACAGAEGEDSITEVVQNYCTGNLITFGVPADPDVSCLDDYDLNASFGEDLRVTVSYRYDFLLLPNFVTSLAGGLNLNAATVMKYE